MLFFAKLIVKYFDSVPLSILNWLFLHNNSLSKLTEDWKQLKQVNDKLETLQLWKIEINSMCWNLYAVIYIKDRVSFDWRLYKAQARAWEVQHE